MLLRGWLLNRDAVTQMQLLISHACFLQGLSGAAAAGFGKAGASSAKALAQ